MKRRDYSWALRHYDRMVEHLNLWDENPRLDPSEKYIYLRDFVEGIISTPTDRRDFLDLTKSIVEKGFLPFDPVIVWKDEDNGKYIVAEGNRRVAALKLLLNPLKSPKSIRHTMVFLSKQIEHHTITKIHVTVAPSFDDAIWYINQRHTPEGHQKKWGRENHLRWISGLYDRFDKNIDLIQEYTDISESELNKSICILKIKDRIDDIQSELTKEEYDMAKSRSFPISTLERILMKDFIQEKMGFSFIGSNVEYNSTNESFLKAFAYIIKRMLLPIGTEGRIDSRTYNTNKQIEEIRDNLPEIQMKDKDNNEQPNVSVLDIKPEGLNTNESTALTTKTPEPLKNNPRRPNIVIKSYELQADDIRLVDIFNELKKLSLNLYPNISSAAIRIFLDISVRNFIETEGYDVGMAIKHKRRFEDIGLQDRLKYIKENSDKLNRDSKKIIAKLLDHEYQYSLDVLNCYIHSSKMYTINKEYMNSFWDFLFPLFENILEIKENQ